MNWKRSGRAVLFVGGLSLLGCRSEEPPTPTPAPTDARGDWEDTGRYAACRLTTDASCGDLATFDLSECDKGSLGGLPRDGIFTLVYRSDSTTPFIDAGSFRVSWDGRRDSFRGVLPSQRLVDTDDFFL